MAMAVVSRASTRPLSRAARRTDVRCAAAKTIISSPKAPAALGPYSQAVKAGGMIYISGCLGLDPESMMLCGPTVEEQTEAALTNMGYILEEAGLDFSHVVKTTVLLADMADFGKVNKIYGKYFTGETPARACYCVKDLPLAGLVEIEAVAVAE